MKHTFFIDNTEILPGKKCASWWELFDEFDGPVKIPLLVANGVNPGKCLYMASGIYGDEYTGMEAIYRLFRWLNPLEMFGQVICVPVLNIPAFREIKRTGPDEVNMNRVGSGSSDGTQTERIVYHFMKHIVSKADYGIELIDIGLYYSITSFVAPVKKSNGLYDLDYAKSFGSEFIWNGSASSSVLRNAVAQNGVDVIMTEIGGGGLSLNTHIEFQFNGLKNLLKYTSIIRGDVEGCPVQYQPFEQFWLSSHSGGIFRCNLKLRQKVKKGELLATVSDMLDRTLEEIRSPYEGFIIGRRNVARIRPGEWTVWVGKAMN